MRSIDPRLAAAARRTSSSSLDDLASRAFTSVSSTGRHPAELLVIGAVLGSIALVIVPVPTGVLDVLLAANLALSVLVLTVCLSIPSPAQLASFPSILLISALFRVSLNVSTTRWILARGEAGTVVPAFGGFVVQGNFVVGLVLFLVLAVVQLVVVTRGAERVAEVGARFVLDGLPGQQMAIDADLRAGSIDAPTARQRREALVRETRFHGAMDGAMRFVKGDAIASLVIVSICLVAGVAIGAIQRGMPVDVALKRYATLAVGDGLLTQIPSLLFSASAAILATRVASDHASTSLGTDVLHQLLRTARPLAATALLVALFALVPGLPALPFLVIAVALGAVAYRVGTRAAVPVETAFVLHTNGALRDDERARFARLVRDTAARLGLDDSVSFATTSEREMATRIELRARGATLADLVVTDAAPTELVAALRKSASRLLSIDVVQARVDALTERQPVLVKSVVPSPISLTLLWQIERELLRDRVSIRPLDRVFESLLQHAGDERDPVALSLRIRDDSAVTRTHELADADGVIRVFELHPMIEDSITTHLVRSGASTSTSSSVPPAVARDILEALQRAVEGRLSRYERVIILARPTIRGALRQLLSREMPGIEVIATSELSRDATVEILGRIAP